MLVINSEQCEPLSLAGNRLKHGLSHGCQIIASTGQRGPVPYKGVNNAAHPLRGRWRQTATLTYNFFFSRSYHAVLASRPHLAILLLLGWEYSTCGILPQRGAQPLTGTLVTDRNSSACKLTLTRLPLPCISCRHQHISFHNNHTILFNNMITSTYFHRFFLSRESLIDGLVKGQY